MEDNENEPIDTDSVDDETTVVATEDDISLAKKSHAKIVVEMNTLAIPQVNDSAFMSKTYVAILKRIVHLRAMLPFHFLPQYELGGFAIAREVVDEALFTIGARGTNWVGGGVLADDMGLGKSNNLVGLMSVNMPGECDLVIDDDPNGVDDPNGAERHNGKTLLIAPGNIIPQWERVLETADRRLFRVTTIKSVKQGTALSTTRSTTNRFGKGNNVVLMSSELLKHDKSVGWLYTTNWHRVIIDKGHMIKDPKTKTARNASKISSVLRWICWAATFKDNKSEIVTQLRWIGFKADRMNTPDRLMALMESCMMKHAKADV